MKKKIVLYSNGFHAFIINETIIASENFDKVVLICPYNKELESICSIKNNIEYIIFDGKLSLKKIISSIKYINWNYLCQIFRGIINLKFNKDFVYVLLSYLYTYAFLINNIKSIINNCESEWIIMSLWFQSTAYAVSRIKDKFQNIKAYSLAHSFEIDDRKNKCVDYSFKDYCHKKLDKIFFISKKVLEEYLEKHVKKNNWVDNKIEIYYLGTIKKNNNISSFSNNDSYHIVSCSNCIPVKRIDLIIESLNQIQDKNIIWTHIGDGILFEELKQKSLSLPKNIKVNWLGKRPNSFIHDFFVENKIDMFINVSLSEGIPISLMEAIAYGIPIVATDVGGNSEIVEDTKNGYLLPENPNISQITKTILKIINLSDEEKKLMKNNAIETFNSKFNSLILRPKFYQYIKNM